MQIFGDTTASTAGIVITRGSDVFVNGTAAMPVVMSSADGGNISTAANNFSGYNEWGGLIIDGFGVVNEGAEVLSEAAPDSVNRYFGGNDPSDDSGEIHYLVVTESGQEFRLDQEIQGLTLEGVGSGTVIDHVQVHQSGDDGIEWFGGTVNAKYVVITAPDDDGLDMDLGYQGGIQFAIVKQSDTRGDRGIESDNNGGNFDALPRSLPTIANITLIGDVGKPTTTTTGAYHHEGFGAFFHKAIITGGFELACLDIDDRSDDVTAGRLSYDDSIFNCAAGSAAQEGDAGDAGETAILAGSVTQIDPQLDADIAAQNAAAQLASATSVTFTDVRANSDFPDATWDDAFFTNTDYIGAVDPNDPNPWWQGWTLSEGSGSLTGTDFHPLRAEIEGGTIVPAASANCPTGTSDAGQMASLFGVTFPICLLNADITASTTLTNDHVYLVSGTINVGKGGGQGVTP
ncbi:MAG: hypothetical protein AB1451_12775 [Nitrospirota bacterium]